MSVPNDPMAELRASFFVECDELLEALQDGLEQLRSGPEDPETVNVVFRAVHSIKGGAGAFGLTQLVDFAHHYETALDALRAGRLGTDGVTLRTFVHAADHLSDLVQATRDDREPDADRGPDLIARLAALTSDTPAPAPVFEPAPIALPLAPAAATLRPDPAARATPPPSSMVRVDLERVERLVNLVGELVINQSMLAQSLEQLGLSPHSDAMNELEEFQRLTRDIQDSVMMIRAQPVKPLFQRMARIVRETSAALGKEVNFITEGEATEVDKTIIERLADPLTHMIRNAVDHGLDTAEARRAADKPPVGEVRLCAAHRSGRIVIEVADDGPGIDRPRVLKTAITRGLIPEDTVLTEGEIDNLLFLPGFSTASSVSDLSGRGVGMDVVKTAIQQLGGRISISSDLTRGTTFSISLPLTLAVLDGMVINVADETLVLPLSAVVKTLSLRPGEVRMIRPGAHVISLPDGFVPLYDLGVMMGYRPARDIPDSAIVLLVTLEDDSRAALVIDGIQDQRQVVIKGLDQGFCRAPGIAAATILGDGRIALILDPSDAIAAAAALTQTDLTEPERLDAHD